MKFNKLELLNELSEETQANLAAAEAWQSLNIEVLNFRSDTGKWSMLECIEHLNRYGRFYLPEIRSRIEKSETGSYPDFRCGLLGGYFAESMRPKEKLNKMKTFKSMNPQGSELGRETLTEFIDQQKIMLDLLELAKQYNLTGIKTAITISKWIKLRLGDTFRVVVHHNTRHIVQAKKELHVYRNSKYVTSTG